MKNGRLTEKDHWENRWERIRLPTEIRRDTEHPVSKEILKVFHTYLPHRAGLTILEIGGAPGPRFLPISQSSLIIQRMP